METDFNIKPLMTEYEAFMWELLYQAIFVARESELADRDIKDLPTLKKYIEHWGTRDDDIGFVAIDKNNQPLGAVWVRLFKKHDKTWGFVGNNIPELNIATVESVRNQGIGTALLEELLDALSGKYPSISLSVNPKNRCVGLYHRHGFKEHKACEDAITMIKKL